MTTWLHNIEQALLIFLLQEINLRNARVNAISRRYVTLSLIFFATYNIPCAWTNLLPDIAESSTESSYIHRTSSGSSVLSSRHNNRIGLTLAGTF